MRKLKVNTYAILSECIEIGINRGWNRAYKYTETPTDDKLKEELLHYIMLEISEKFKFDE
jgi:hypothetical protein